MDKFDKHYWNSLLEKRQADRFNQQARTFDLPQTQPFNNSQDGI